MEILLADNNVDERLLVREILHQLNSDFKLVYVGSIAAFWEYLNATTAQNGPLAILIDPYKQFLYVDALINQLKNHKTFASLPILLWTKHPTAAFYRLIAGTSVTDCFIKTSLPSDWKRFLSKALAAIAAHRSPFDPSLRQNPTAD